MQINSIQDLNECHARFDHKPVSITTKNVQVHGEILIAIGGTMNLWDDEMTYTVITDRGAYEIELGDSIDEFPSTH